MCRWRKICKHSHLQHCSQIMEVPLSQYNSLDLGRQLYAHAKHTEGSEQERRNCLNAARLQAAQATCRPNRPKLEKLGACVQLDQFMDIQAYNQAEFDLLTKKLQWRLEYVRKTEDNQGLEYFHTNSLDNIDDDKTYMLCMDEFLVRQEPYVHKIFAIFVSRTNGQEYKLCYARSLATQCSWNEATEQLDWPLITNESISRGTVTEGIIQKTLITPDNIAQALTYILTEIESKGLHNYVAIVCDEHRLNMSAVIQLLKGNNVLPLIYDIQDLQKSFRNMFCSASVRVSMRLASELYAKRTFEDQLNKICNSNTTKNVNAALLLMDSYVNPLSDILSSMWSFAEHSNKQISVAGLNSQLLKLYATHVKRELPPITFEDCVDGAGLLQLIVFDTLWYISQEPEPEELEASRKNQE